MSASDDLKGRLTAQADQVHAAGMAAVDNREVLDAVHEWALATKRMAHALLEAGLPADALMGALLAPTANLVVEVQAEM